MNFLNKAKEQANNIINKKEGSPMTNPFLNKNTLNNQTAPKVPAATPTAPTGIPSAPAVPGAIPKPGVPKAPGKPGMPPIPGKPGVPPVPKAPSVPGANPFAKPEVKPAEETKTANDIANEIVKEVEAKEIPVTGEAPVVPVEEKVETPAEAPKTEEVKEEPKAEEKKTTAKKRSSSRKKTASKTDEVNDAPTTSDEVVNVIINTTELSYAEACQAVRTHFTDPEWEAAKAKFEEIAKNIHITNDMNKAQLHDLLAQVANLRDEIYSAYTETKTLYEHLTDKENGMIERTKRTGAKGSNSEERKLTATLAVMNYVDGNGNKINLYEVLDETRIRYNYLKGIIDTIEFKKAVLLTMLSSLKSN